MELQVEIATQHEAEVLASLNHPDIAAIYDLEESNGSRFLVLELVEGETLSVLWPQLYENGRPLLYCRS